METNWCNQVNEDNFTHLQWRKVGRPTIEESRGNYRGKDISYGVMIDTKMCQSQWKAYKKRNKVSEF